MNHVMEVMGDWKAEGVEESQAKPRILLILNQGVRVPVDGIAYSNSLPYSTEIA